LTVDLDVSIKKSSLPVLNQNTLSPFLAAPPSYREPAAKSKRSHHLLSGAVESCTPYSGRADR
jgi:hypothetical protein